MTDTTILTLSLKRLANGSQFKTPCSACGGLGEEADYVGAEMKCVSVPCWKCRGSGLAAAAQEGKDE